MESLENEKCQWHNPGLMVLFELNIGIPIRRYSRWKFQYFIRQKVLQTFNELFQHSLAEYNKWWLLYIFIKFAILIQIF